MRSAAAVVNLCRLPRRPHEVLGLALSPSQALLFDMTMLAASQRVDASDDLDALATVAGKDLFGTAAVSVLLARRGQRG